MQYNIALVVRRECFDRAGLFDESLATSEDWDMWLRIAVGCEFAFVDRVLAHIRRHEGSTTGKQAPSFAGFLGSRHKVLDKFFDRGDLPPRIAGMRPIAYRNLYVFEGNVWMGASGPLPCARSPAPSAKAEDPSVRRRGLRGLQWLPVGSSASRPAARSCGGSPSDA
jgi:hypothetical protein